MTPWIEEKWTEKCPIESYKIIYFKAIQFGLCLSGK